MQTNNKLEKSIVAIPRNVYYYFKEWTLRDIEKEWDATKTGYSKDDQMQLYHMPFAVFMNKIIAKMAIRSGLLKTTKQHYSFLADFGTHLVFKARFALYVQTSLKKLLTLI